MGGAADREDGDPSILFVTAIGCLLPSLPIGTDGWSDAQPAKVSNIV
jgi:hypothetical protein